MLYIPGIGYIPLSSLGGLPGLNLGGARQTQAAPNPEGERDWKGFTDMPAVTQQSIEDLALALQEDDKKDLTILVIGKGGAGKSSTINSILNESAASVLPFQQDSTRPIVYSRKAPIGSDGFVLNIIDTPSLLDQDAVSEARLEAIAKSIKDKEIDAIIFLDRLDEYSVSRVDRAVIEGVTRFFGPAIWENTVLCFTRGSESSAPPGIDFYEHVATRETQVKNAIARSGGDASNMASALIENNSSCPTNPDGEKIVAGDVPWVIDVIEKVVEISMEKAPFEYSAEAAAKASNPNRRRKWLIPLILAAQVGIKLLLDRVMDDDGCRGDENGPFDAQTVKERRAELKEEREEERRNKQKATKVGGRDIDYSDDDNYNDDDSVLGGDGDSGAETSDWE